jgi:hypothetical protein
MPNPQSTRWLAQVPDQPNDIPTPDTDEPTTGDDDAPATPPTEPEPVPIEDPRPDTQPPGPYVV